MSNASSDADGPNQNTHEILTEQVKHIWIGPAPKNRVPL